MKTKNIILFFCLLLSIQIQAVHFRKLGPKNGLAHPAVFAISQDSIGRIWFGTAEGISIYDGKRVISHRPNPNISTSFKGNSVSKIVSNSKGDIFLKIDDTFVKYDIRKETFQTILDKGVLVVYSHQDTIWVITAYTLNRWDEKEGKLIKSCKLSAGTIYDFLIDDKGHKWFTYSNGLVYSDDDIHFKSIIKCKDMRTIFQANSGDIWIGSVNDGLFRIHPDGTLSTYNTSNAFSKGFYNNFIRSITEDKEGNIWFGTFNGLYKYDLQKDLFISHKRDGKAGSLSHSSVHSVFIDKKGILWAGTYFGGVNYVPVHEDTFTYYDASACTNSLSNPVVGDMTEDTHGNIWICTEGGGLNMLNPQREEIKHFETTIPPTYLPHINLKSILYDSETEKLFIGTNGKGLYTYNIKQNIFQQEINQKDAPHLRSINAMERDGERLFLSTNKNIYIYSLKSRKDTLIYRTNMYAHISLDTNKNLWIVEGKQVHKFDTHTLKELHTYDLEKQGIYGSVVRSFHSSEKDIYITTLGNGVLKLNQQNNQFEPFPVTSSPLLSQYCYQIKETNAHNLVITGDKGIIFLNKKGDILQSFSVGRYLPLDAFAKDCGLLISKNGTIYVGGTNGLIAATEKNENIHPTNNRIYFTELYVHNNLIHPNDQSGILSVGLPFTKEIRLPHNQNRIEILFSSQIPLENNQRIYEYRLKGIDKIWYQTVLKSVSYTNLPTGNYILEIREKNNSTQSAKETTQLKITILPPWYATWWAWLIWITLFLLITGFIINILYARKKMRDAIRKEQMEKQQMKEINEAKFKFFTSVSHEFRTPLALIIGQLEVLLLGNNLAPFIYGKLLKVIHQCQQLNNLVTELIEFRKYEQGRNILYVSAYPINQYIGDICDGFRELALQQNIDFKLEPCETETEVWFDGKQMIKVIYNLLSNAFKYTPKGGTIKIGLSVNEPENRLYIRITDSGVGIDAKDIPYIFERFYQANNKMPEQKQLFRAGIGLALVKSIVEEHLGTINVQSRIGEGSIFTISLQLGKEHLLNNQHIIFKNEEKDINTPLPILTDNILAPEKTEVEESSNPIDGEKPTIVLIEDNKELLDILVTIFSPLYITKTATNGQEGLEIIRKINPDLIVSDVMMPIMSGTELCIKIKNNIELCHIPIILLTALNMPEQHLEGLVRGADDYIYKPFSPQILLARCNNIIRSRRMLYKQFSQKAEADISLLATNNLDKEFLEKITFLIDENISDQEFSIDKLASEMYMGRTTFYNKFKSLTGMSPNDFINSHKLKRAAVLLRQDNSMSISEIADNLGFNSPNYFCRKFKEQFNVAPSQYKQKYQEERKEK